jgi:hypothetical protein
MHWGSSLIMNPPKQTNDIQGFGKMDKKKKKTDKRC